MKESNQDEIKRRLKPYRKRIDKIDDKLLVLLGERFGVVRTVAALKSKHDIPAFLGDRVDEVRNRAVTRAKKYGISPDFMQTFYTLMIYESCATEELIKHKAAKKKTARKKTIKKKKS